MLKKKKETKKVKIAFAGSGSFAEPIFSKLTENFDNLILISKEDKPKGRNGKTEKSAIKILADAKNIPIFEPKTKSELEAIIIKIKPDLVVVASLGIIITENTLKVPTYGFINVHFSLLPLHRGPSPVQFTILEGDKKAGITIQKVVPEIDTGDVIFRKEIGLNGSETTEFLGKILTKLASKNIMNVVLSYINGKVVSEKQDDSKSTLTKIIEKSDGRINWNDPAAIIERKVRAYKPWPSAYTFWNGKLLKIIEATASDTNSGQTTGTFLDLGDKKCGIQAGNGTLVVTKLQLEGKKPLDISDFLLGNSKIIGDILA